MTDSIAAPCRIYHKNRSAFVVKDINAWTYINSDWVQADGYWADDPGRAQEDVLIPTNSIDHIEVDYPALEAFVEAQAVMSEEPKTDDKNKPWLGDRV
jgi:hypothetical protein